MSLEKAAAIWAWLHPVSTCCVPGIDRAKMNSKWFSCQWLQSPVSRGKQGTRWQAHRRGWGWGPGGQREAGKNSQRVCQVGVLGVRTGILDGEVGASTFKGRVQYHSTEFTRGGGGSRTLWWWHQSGARLLGFQTLILFDLPDIPKVSEPQFPPRCYYPSRSNFFSG